MDIVVENLRGVVVLVASLLGFAAQAAPYVDASRNERAADVYVEGDRVDDVYQAGGLGPLVVEPSRLHPKRLDAKREASRNGSASNVPDERLSQRLPVEALDGEEAPPAAHAALVRVVASARPLTPSSP